MATKIPLVPAPLTRTLAEIAREIRTSNAPAGAGYYAAAPYVGALGSMHTTELGAAYGDDRADELVIRLLGNLSSWRGPIATRVKAELRAALAHHEETKRAAAADRQAVARGKRTGRPIR